jgi:phage recombination protein Bet
MTTGRDLAPALAASVAYVREAKRQQQQKNIGAAPVPPKRLKRKRMTNAIELAEHRAIAVHQEQLEFTSAQRAMIRDTYANGASEKEFQVLLEVAKLRRLNPLLRQIHFVKRWNGQLKRDVWSAQVSVDGLRAIAERTGKYDGQDEAEFGPMVDGFPEWARVKVYRKDWRRPAVGTAYWSEYVQRSKEGGPTRFWKEMPRVMLAKCAEAIAMRKAFPEDMGGLYTDEEMQQTENERPMQLSPHRGPGDGDDAGDEDLFRSLCGRFSTIESELDACDSWEKANALRALLGTRSVQSELTRTMQQKAESGDISPSQRQELGKTWMRCNRKLEKLEERLKPSVEATFTDEPDGTEALGAPEREPGSDDE